MSLRKIVAGLAVAGMIMLVAAGAVFAQAGGPGRNPRGGGNFDPAAWMQQRMDGLKADLGATDEEWKVLQPKVEAVMTLNNQVASTRMGGFGRRGGRGGGPGGGGAATQPANDLQAKLQALETALQNPETPATEIMQKLTEYRDALAKARQELAAAQAALKELLTPKQEAQLVVAGVLE